MRLGTAETKPKHTSLQMNHWCVMKSCGPQLPPWLIRDDSVFCWTQTSFEETPVQSCTTWWYALHFTLDSRQNIYKLLNYYLDSRQNIYKLLNYLDSRQNIYKLLNYYLDSRQNIYKLLNYYLVFRQNIYKLLNQDVVLGGIPVHTEYRCLFFLRYEFLKYRNTGVI